VQPVKSTSLSPNFAMCMKQKSKGALLFEMHILSMRFFFCCFTYFTGTYIRYSPPSSAEVKNGWSYTSTPLYVSMARCLVKHMKLIYNPTHSEEKATDRW
jgi:hypothetical protein